MCISCSFNSIKYSSIFMIYLSIFMSYSFIFINYSLISINLVYLYLLIDPYYFYHIDNYISIGYLILISHGLAIN